MFYIFAFSKHINKLTVSIKIKNVIIKLTDNKFQIHNQKYDNTYFLRDNYYTINFFNKIDNKSY